MQFHYKAVKKDGEVVEANIDAIDKFAVYNKIKKEGSTIISVDKAGKRKFIDFLKNSNSLFVYVKTSEKIMLAKNLSAMLSAGLSVSRSLDTLIKQTKNRKLKKALTAVNNDVISGSELNIAIGKFSRIFPPLFVSMVKAGEKSGNLANSLKIVASHMKRSYDLKKKVKGALIYPLIIIIVMVIIGIIMLTHVVPTLTKIFEELNVDLPLSTQFIITISDFITGNTVIAIIIFIITAVSLFIWMKTRNGKRTFDFTILHIPIISNLIKEINSARTAHTLSSLLSSGVDMVLAISITGEVIQNSYYKDVLNYAKEDVQKGAPLSKIFKENEEIYPVLVGEMMAVGEETGQLSNMLIQISDFYESEVDQKTKNISTIIEPFLMVFIGAAVGFFAISMISPIYSISSGI